MLARSYRGHPVQSVNLQAVPTKRSLIGFSMEAELSIGWRSGSIILSLFHSRDLLRTFTVTTYDLSIIGLNEVKL